MTRKSHIHLLLLATGVWGAFWLAGLPSYYQQYSTAAMVAFDVVILVPITGIVWFVLRGVKSQRRLRVSLWFAFYFTVPLAIYDWLYCGLYLGHGMRFVGRFWYLSVYYAIPWAVLPLVALMLDQRNAREGETPIDRT